MGIIKNPTELSGMLGESVAIRKVNGRVVLTNRPQRKRPNPTGKQTALREKFLEASKYAKRQTDVEESKALYLKGITNKKRSAYMVALSDYLVAPKVTSIDTIDYHGTIGNKLVITAKDDFMVTRVKVMITNGAGIIIEEGEAIQDVDKDHLWEYKATVANVAIPGTKILAIAYDRPANAGRAEVVL